MCIGSSPDIPPSAPLLLSAPTPLDPVVRAGEDMKRKAQAAVGYSSTITNSGGVEGSSRPSGAPVVMVGLRNRNPLRRDAFPLTLHPNPAAAGSFNPPKITHSIP